MAKKAYIGIDGIARKIKKGYIGVDGVARKIKKAYIGVGGVARPCWSGGGIDYYGAITPLSVGVAGLAGASIPGFALFACGRNGTGAGAGISYYSKTIDVYNTALTLTCSLDLSNMVIAGTDTSTSLNSREYLSAGSVNETAIFAGGSRSTTTYVNDAFSVNTSMTLARIPSGQYMQSNAHKYATTSVGNHVLFANGTGAERAYYRTVEAYDSSLTKKTCATTSKAEGSRAATTVGNKAIIAGGVYGNASNTYDTTIDVYDDSLTKITTGIALSVGRSNLGAETVNGNALFVGGTYYTTRYNVVDAYNESLTHNTSVAPLSESRMDIPSVNVEGTAMFFGGNNANNSVGSRSATVDLYDSSLTKTEVQPLTEARQEHAAAKVGSFALVGGGVTASATCSSSVEAYVYS